MDIVFLAAVFSISFLEIAYAFDYEAYLPGVEVNHDQEGGSSRVRPCHCTTVGLTPTITPNVGNSNA